MKLISERILRIQEQSGKNQLDFATSIGISDRTLRAYIAQQTKPSVEALQAIARYYNVSGNWLLLGEGPIYQDQTPSSVSSSNVQDTNINLLGNQTIKTTEQHQDTASLYAQIAEMQKQISILINTNQQLVAQLIKQ